MNVKLLVRSYNSRIQCQDLQNKICYLIPTLLDFRKLVRKCLTLATIVSLSIFNVLLIFVVEFIFWGVFIFKFVLIFWSPLYFWGYPNFWGGLRKTPFLPYTEPLHNTMGYNFSRTFSNVKVLKWKTTLIVVRPQRKKISWI